MTVAVPLPATVGMRPAVLGSVTPTRVRDVPVSVHLPVARPDEHHLFRPAVLDWLDPETEYTSYSDADDRPESPWGFTIAEGDGPVLGVSQVVLTAAAVDDGEAKAVVRTLTKHFGAWFDSMKDWCEALTLQDLDYVAPRRRFAIEGAHWGAWFDQTGVGTLGHMAFDFDYGEPLELAPWERICVLASSGSRPSTEHLLLRDVRGALNRHLYRRSVVDAATAMEIALYELLHAEFRADQSKLAGQLIDLAERWTLGTLVTNVGKIVTLPLALNTDAVGLRNKVVHRSAYTPTEDEAGRWLALATAVVTQANPMPAVR
ncbi:MAG: hypothetical protein ACR2G7_08800 [Acidimicrobiales bacterium]